MYLLSRTAHHGLIFKQFYHSPEETLRPLAPAPRVPVPARPRAGPGQAPIHFCRCRAAAPRLSDQIDGVRVNGLSSRLERLRGSCVLGRGPRPRFFVLLSNVSLFRSALRPVPLPGCCWRRRRGRLCAGAVRTGLRVPSRETPAGAGPPGAHLCSAHL